MDDTNGRTKNMSFSMYIDNVKRPGADDLNDIQAIVGTPPERDFASLNLSKIYPKETRKWIDSSLVVSCQRCTTQFGFFIRKHHCRACGGVFCGSCCYKYISIPEKYIHKPEEDESLKHKLSSATKWLMTTNDAKENESRVCNECFDKINNLNKINDITLLCENSVLNGKINIEILENILNLTKNWCNDWHNTAIHQLSKFRAIQYIYPNDEYSTWDIEILWNSRKLLVGHNNWIPSLIKSTIQYYYKTKKNDRFDELKKIVSVTGKTKLCWNLMCSRKCNINLDILDYIEIIKFILVLEKSSSIFWSNFEIKHLLVSLFENVYSGKIFDENLAKCSIPLLCSVMSELMDKPRDLIDYKFVEDLFEIFSKNINMTYFLSEINYLDSTILKSMGISNLIKFMKDYLKKKLGGAIFDQMRIMKTSIVNIANGQKNKFDPILYPFDYEYLIVKINKIEQINSNTRPLLITATILKNEANTKSAPKTVKFIIKQDYSLRKERIISCLITLIQERLCQQAQRKRIPLFDKIPTYRIDMITEKIGVIEFVENSLTLRMINDTGLTLQNYVLENNPNDTIEIAKTRFYKSLAISSCLSFILGLGDRHLDNIMINKEGLIFHIDYGYLMENPVTSILSAPTIKVTHVMIDFLGGQNGLYYKKFKDYVIQVYDIMRLYKNVIINHYEIIANEKFIDWTSFKDKLESRFMDGMNCKDVEITLINEIETSITYRSSFSDLCHNYRIKMSGWFSS